MSIVIENLSHIYMKGSPFEKTALSDINLKIGEEEFVAIIGPTGSGKSTLVQHFNGLLKPTQGKIIVNDMEVSSSNLKELRKQVGIVFQYPEHQLFEETVYKDIAFGLQKQGVDTAEIDERIRNTIKMVGLHEDVLEKSPFELSGGQKRRVAIAGVLVMSPKILVLDEPTAGLDPRGRDEIFNFILQLYKDMHMTIILVSHSMEDVARVAKRVIVMNKGKIAMDGYAGEVFSKVEQLEAMGLSAPQISYLMRKLKKAIPDINENIFTVNEAKKEIMKYL